MDTIGRLVSLMTDKGERRYGLHDVTQLQHALQAAMFAERAGGTPALITASSMIAVPIHSDGATNPDPCHRPDELSERR